jgi:hypothetical protein
MTEAELPNLSDADLLALHRGMEADDPMLDLVLGEIERRELDI